jgi:hypothetical protein
MESTTEITRTRPPLEPWKTKTLIIGGVLGVLIGLGGAYLFIQSFERRGEKANISAGEGVKLGLLLMGLLRQIATLGEGK